MSAAQLSAPAVAERPELPGLHLSRGFASRRVWHESFVILSVFIITSLIHVIGEKIDVNGGFGWDGKFYGYMAQSFNQVAFELGLNTYVIQRLVPSLLVHLGLLALSLEPTEPRVVAGFVALNVCCLTFASFLWTRIAALLGIGPKGLWLGAIGLFANFACLKWSGYYPVLTDVPALLLGTWMIYCYLSERRWQLLAVTIVSAFTWPLAVYVGVALLIFDRSSARWIHIGQSPTVWGLLPALIGTVAVLAIHLTTDISTYPTWQAHYWPALPLAVIVSMGYFFVGVGVITATLRIEVLPLARQTLLSGWTYCGLLLLALVRIVQSERPLGLAISNAESLAKYGWSPADATNVMWTLSQTWSAGLVFPGFYLVAHPVYFGPLAMVVILRYRQVATGLVSYGMGLLIVTLIALFFLHNPESRKSNLVFPILAVFAIKAVDSLPLRWSDVVAFAGLALVISKVWLVVGPALTPQGGLNPLLFDSLGPFMSFQAYLVQGLLVLVLGWWLSDHWLHPRGRLGESQAAAVILSST